MCADRRSVRNLRAPTMAFSRKEKGHVDQSWAGSRTLDHNDVVRANSSRSGHRTAKHANEDTKHFVHEIHTKRSAQSRGNTLSLHPNATQQEVRRISMSFLLGPLALALHSIVSASTLCTISPAPAVACPYSATLTHKTRRYFTPLTLFSFVCAPSFSWRPWLQREGSPAAAAHFLYPTSIPSRSLFHLI